MKKKFIKKLICPVCGKNLLFLSKIDKEDQSEIYGGIICCRACRKEYPVKNGIPIFLLNREIQQQYSPEARESVRKYYDGIGWKEYSEITIDSAKNIDLRIDTPKGLYQDFPKKGNFILDAGCGANPRISLSGNYREHVCVDFSLKGLELARLKLSKKGFYVCSDIINLPFPDNVFDAIICDHCLYHFKPNEQIMVIDELYRVLADKGVMYVSYTKGNAWFPLVWERNITKVLRKTPVYFLYHLAKRNRMMKSSQKKYLHIDEKFKEAGVPVFHPLSMKWWREQLKKKDYKYSFKGIGFLSAQTTKKMPRCVAVFLTNTMILFSRIFKSRMLPIVQYYYICISKH